MLLRMVFLYFFEGARIKKGHTYRLVFSNLFS